MNFKKVATIVAAAGALTALAIPAMAEVTLYGSARTATFWDTNQPAQAVGAAKPDTNTDFDLRNQSNSRFGAKGTNGDVFGHVELGLGLEGTGGNTTVYTRLIYGTFKTNAGTLLIGQTYTPYWVGSEQVANNDNGNIGYGGLYDGRQPQIKFTMNNGLYVAAIRPGGNAAIAANSETYIPKLNVGYEGKAGNFGFGAGVVGQISKNTAADEQVVAALGYFHGNVAAGPAAIKFNLGVGQNLTDLGISGEGSSAVSVSGTNVENNLTIAGLVQAGFVLAPTAKLNVGLGYATTDGKTATSATTSADWKKADNQLAFFVNAPITIAKGLTVVPEISYIDKLDEKDGSKGTKDTIYGAKWQFDF